MLILFLCFVLLQSTEGIFCFHQAPFDNHSVLVDCGPKSSACIVFRCEKRLLLSCDHIDELGGNVDEHWPPFCASFFRDCPKNAICFHCKSDGCNSLDSININWLAKIDNAIMTNAKKPAKAKRTALFPPQFFTTHSPNIVVADHPLGHKDFMEDFAVNLSFLVNLLVVPLIIVASLFLLMPSADWLCEPLRHREKFPHQFLLEG